MGFMENIVSSTHVLIQAWHKKEIDVFDAYIIS